jgi:hypothetical protein
MSQRGELPLLKGKAGTMLYNSWREAANRMREDERQSFYAMTLGLPHRTARRRRQYGLP